MAERENNLTLRHPAALSVAIMCLVAGLVLNPIPRDPDTAFHSLDRYATFSIFCFWSIAVVCWGRIIAMAVREPNAGWVHWLAYGTLGASFSATLLCYAGLLGYETRWLFILLALLGPLVELVLRQRAQPAVHERDAESGRTIRLLNAFLLAAIAFEVASRLFGASIAHFHSDPMFNHLFGPRLWFDAGAIGFSPLAPITMQCSYWEALAIWANELVAGPRGTGLIDSLLFMQWAHVCFGYAASAFAIERILKHINTPLHWRRLAVFAALTSGMLGWTAWLAKNDWGLAFWALAGFCFLLEARAGELRGYLIGGAFIGMAVANKYVIALPALALLLGWAWGKRQLRPLLLAGLGTGLTLLPVLFRNWYYLENPFYPVLNGFFHSPWVTESLAMFLKTAQQPTRFGFTWLSIERLQLLFQQDTLLLLGAAIPFMALLQFRRREPARLGALDLVPILALTLFFAFIGRPSGPDDLTLHLRYLGFMLALAPALGISFLQRCLQAARVGLVTELALMTVLFSIAAYKFQNPLVQELYDPPTALRVSLAGGDGKAWLRLHAAADELIFTTGDDQLYPVAHLNILSMRLVPYLDWIALHVTEPEKFVTTLKGLGVRYVLDSKTPTDLNWSMAAVTLEHALFRHPEAIVFSGGRSKVVDLDRLFAGLFLSCGNGRSE